MCKAGVRVDGPELGALFQSRPDMVINFEASRTSHDRTVSWRIE